VDFLIYKLTATALHLGERAKGNLFKPCLRTIPFSAITGALRRQFADGGVSADAIRAVGFLQTVVGANRVELLTYAPRDRVQEVSKLPLQAEFLADVVATVVVIDSNTTKSLPEKLEITLGGMQSHGFGRAELQLREKQAAGKPRPGLLRVRLPEDEVPNFGILKVETPIYGYLFRPSPGTHSGVYVRSVFEGSRVVGPELLLEPKTGAGNG
jgi:hypothetical protein